MIERAIQYQPAIEPARTEWFLAGTDQSIIRFSPPVQTDKNELARILEPVNGMITALDPDIPPNNQRIVLLSNHDDVVWSLNKIEHTIGTGQKVAWLPLPGRHILLLSTPEGELLDQIRIEVRGANMLRKPVPSE